MSSNSTSDVGPPADATTNVGPLSEENRDRRTIRRALRAGMITTLALTILTLLANLVFGGDAYAVAVWISSAVVVGTLVSAGWLVLAMILDLSAGAVPTRRRIMWTLGMFAASFIAPVLPAAVLQVAAQR